MEEKELQSSGSDTEELLPVASADEVIEEEAPQQPAECKQQPDGEGEGQEVEVDLTAVPHPDWSFGAEAQQETACCNKRGLKGFFAIFGGLFLVCVLLLGLTFWLGDAGFKIIREVYFDRTVYVREDGTVVGTYTPGEVAEKLSASTVTVAVKTKLGSGIGSGFVYSENGYIITNYHVIESAESVQVLLGSGTAVDAEIVGYDKAADVAVLKVDAAEKLIPVKTGNSDAVLVGETVVAIGTPAEMNYAGTVTFGKISATRRLVTFSNADGTVTKKMRVIQTDTSVNPGNSGGPLANLDGEVIGVVVMKVSTQGSDIYEGLGFVLPINGVCEIADEIIQKGSFNGKNPIAEGRSLLGVTGHGVTQDYWYRSNENGTIDISPTEQAGFVQAHATGVRVISVEADSDAFGEILYGDVITRVNGLCVYSTVELIDAVNRHFAGESVTLTVARDGAELQIEVRLAEGALS